MIAHLEQTLKAPYDLIDSVFLDNGSSFNGLEQRCSDVFSSLFAEQAALKQLPILTAKTSADTLPAMGSIVRFRAMVQDTGFGNEVFKALSSQGKPLLYGKEDSASDSTQQQTTPSYDNLKERQAFYIVSVPGETGWTQQTETELKESIAKLSLAETSATASVSCNLPNKYPITNEAYFGCIAKMYGDSAETIKTTDVVDFIGILSESSVINSFDELASAGDLPNVTNIPTLHVLFTKPAPNPLERLDKLTKDAQNMLETRRNLINYISAAVGNDLDAAEWILLALLAKIHTRHPTGLALGSLSLNLALPASHKQISLDSLISSLVAQFSTLSLSIPILNDVTTRIAPRSRDESLESGALQLPAGTTILVDTREIGEGKLNDSGVRNLRHVATTIAQQKLSYQFAFSSFELETDLNFIVLSEGKAIIPTDCVVYVHPSAVETSKNPEPNSTELNRFRRFLYEMKNSDFSIPDAMTSVIQDDFVARRQKSVGGEGMTQEDLLFRMTAARLMSLSRGETSLIKEAWTLTAELDERRKDRAPRTAA